MSTYSEKDPLAFLKGSAYIAELILSRDWEATELGHPSGWPLRLKYAISAQLANPCPSFVCWGKDRIFLYNAAFAALFPAQEILPGHESAGPLAFGMHWGKVSAAIADAYDNRGAVVKGVRIGGEGRLGQRYLDISMGTLFELDGEIFGAWGICQEKTFELVAGDILRASQQYLRSLIGNAQIGICVIEADPLQVVEVNNEFLRLLGLSGRGPELLVVVNQLLGNVAHLMGDQNPNYLKEVSQRQLFEGLERVGYIDIMVSPYRSRHGQTIGISVMAIDVTDRVEAQQELYQVNEELAAANEELAASNEELLAINEDLDLAQRNLGSSLEKLGEREQQIRQMVTSAPFPIALYVGREMRIVEVNEAIVAVWGKGPDLIGKTYHQVLPELESQSVYEQLTAVYDTGVPFHARNQRIDLSIAGELKTFYFNYSFTPLYDRAGKVYGVMNTAADVTDLVLAKQLVEQGESNFRNMIMQAPVAMCLLEGPQYKIKLVNEAMAEIWGRDREKVIGLPVFEALPDARAQGLEEAMDQVYHTGEPFYAAEQAISLLRHGKPDVVYQNFVYQPYRDGQGRILGILAISVNVTEMVGSRRKVEDAYGRLNLVVEAANLGMFDLDVKTGKLVWDERCKHFFGLGANSEVDYQEHFVGGLHPEDLVGTLNAIDRAMDPASGGAFNHEYRTVAPLDGEIRWIRAVGQVYFDGGNAAERFIGAVSDMTQTRLAELAEREAAERKSRLAAIVDSSDDVIISKDLNGIVASWNPAAERMFGFTAAEAIGKHISLVIPKERLNEEDLIISNIRQGRKVEHFDTVRKARDGSDRQLSITVSPIVDAEGRVIGASKIARDISAQLAAKQATARYTERVEAINLVINAISREMDTNDIIKRVAQLTIHLLESEVGIFVAEKKVNGSLEHYVAPLGALEAKQLGHVSAEFKKLVSIQGQSITGRADIQGYKRSYNIDERERSMADLLFARIGTSEGDPIGEMYFLHHRPGHFTQEHEELLSSIVGHLSIGIDKALLYEKVLELNMKKDEFISLASHELKTPLSGINGYIQILLRMVKDDLHAKYLSKASQQVKKLTALVNDLLDVSKIEAGKLKFSFVKADLVSILIGTVEMATEISEGYVIDFEHAGLTCPVEVDIQRIEQVLTNLLSNAIKYSPGTDRIEVSLQVREHTAVVGVRDFGIGIPQEKISSLFSRFYRVNEETQNISGLGIGLYLSKEIMDRHHGQIWVESELGEGSTFWFSLPLVVESGP